MKDTLQDIVKHTHSLGFIDLVKIVGDDKKTELDAMAEDRSVVVKSELKSPVTEFQGTFGMPNLGKLDILLKLPVYKDNAQITVNTQEHDPLYISDPAPQPTRLKTGEQLDRQKNKRKKITS